VAAQPGLMNRVKGTSPPGGRILPGEKGEGMAEVTPAATHRETQPLSEQQARPFSEEQKRVRSARTRLLSEFLWYYRPKIRAALKHPHGPDDWISPPNSQGFDKYWADFAAGWFDAEACEFAAFRPTGAELSRWLEELSARSIKKLCSLCSLEAAHVAVKAAITERAEYWTTERCSKRSFAKRVGKYVDQNWPAQARLARTALERIALESGRIPSADDINREVAAATNRLAREFLNSELDALAVEGALVSKDACREVAKDAATALLDELMGVAHQPWFIEPLHLFLRSDWWTAGRESVQGSIGLAQIEACSKQFPPSSENSVNEEVEPRRERPVLASKQPESDGLRKPHSVDPGHARDINRPEICFDRWGPMPDGHPVGVATGQHGFYFTNVGTTAYEIAIEDFEIERSIGAAGETLRRIDSKEQGFLLVWLKNHSRPDASKWDLLGAMKKASDARGGCLGLNYVVRVNATYRDSMNVRYRSSADLTYIPSQGRLQFGATEISPIESDSRVDGGKDFLERLAEDESNKDVTGIFYEAWADSHGLVADVHAGSVSLSDFVDGCVNIFAQGAEAQIVFKDDSSILGKCKELDRMAEEFIRMFTESIEAKSESLDKEGVEAAADHLSRRVNEIAARSKQRVFQEALAGLGLSPKKPADVSSPVQADDGLDALPNRRDLAQERVIDDSGLPEAYKDLIAAAELDAQSILEASQRENNFLKAQAHDLGVSASDIDFAPGNTVLELAEEKIVHGRAMAADHLFRATALVCWKWLRPDIDGFMAELKIRWRRVYQKFHLDPRMPEDTRRAWKSWALKERGAAAEHKAEGSGAATTARPQPEADAVRSEAKAPMDLSDSTEASGEGAMKNPFSQGAKEHPQLIAHWEARQEAWRFREWALDENGKPAHGFSPEPADPKTSDLFAQAVRTAFGLLRNSQDPAIRALTTSLREPYQVWLDLMRREKRGFERIEQLRTGLWSVYARAQETGTPLLPSATILLEDGDIRGVFAESATLWDDIVARAGIPKPFDVSSESVDQRKALSEARRAAVMPILKARHWSRGKWATKAGVGKNCVYEYLDGKRSPSEENRRAMADALDLKPEDLPE
jgi:hypothetical protein